MSCRAAHRWLLDHATRFHVVRHIRFPGRLLRGGLPGAGALVSRMPALAAGLAGFFRRKLVSGALAVGRLATLACNLALLLLVHSRKAALALLCHGLFLSESMNE